MPLFEQMTQEHDDVVVLAVNALPGEGGTARAAEETVREFIADAGYTFPVLLDRDGAVFDSAAYTSQYIPANYVIDREGVLRFRMPGAYGEEILATLLEYMRALSW
jgi:peroxiredoxin